MGGGGGGGDVSCHDTPGETALSKCCLKQPKERHPTSGGGEANCELSIFARIDLMWGEEIRYLRCLRRGQTMILSRLLLFLRLN